MTTPKKPQIISAPCSDVAAGAVGTLQPSRASPASAPTKRPAKPRISKGTRCSGRRSPCLTGKPTVLADNGAVIGINSMWGQTRLSCRIRARAPILVKVVSDPLPAEVLFRDTRHLVGRPGRIPYQPYIQRGSFRHDRRDGAARLVGDHVRHRARRGG